jgi:ABC-type antimicrobial peptide transport system permease subunit
MNYWEAFKSAYTSLMSNRLRTFLTMLGALIGVMAVITLVSMGEGTKGYVVSQFNNFGFGANSIVVEPGEANATLREFTLKIADAQAIRDKMPDLKFVVPEVTGRIKINYGKKEYSTPYGMGESHEYPDAYMQKVIEGKPFTSADVAAAKKVCLIGKTVAKNLFGSSSPVGEKIKINGNGFLIVGVLQEKGSILTFDMDDIVVMPYTLGESVLGTKVVNSIYIAVNDSKEVPETITKIKNLLLSRHRKEDFHLSTQEGMLDIINNVVNALTGIVAAIAAISLLVGGIGIMNIMLVAVTERTREIGIRKAIGAKKNDILMQFLFESVLISFSGAAMGTIVGTLLAFIIMYLVKMETAISLWAVGMACTGAIAVGVFFGVYPAYRAANLSPVDALRHEL